MLRRKFMQLVLVASSSSALSVLGTVARASGGASRNDSGGASRNGSRGSVYCATDANGQQTCRTETSDGLSNVDDSDLDDVLKSFN